MDTRTSAATVRTGDRPASASLRSASLGQSPIRRLGPVAGPPPRARPGPLRDRGPFLRPPPGPAVPRITAFAFARPGDPRDDDPHRRPRAPLGAGPRLHPAGDRAPRVHGRGLRPPPPPRRRA